MTSVEGVPVDGIEFHLKQVESLPYAYLNPLTQTRKYMATESGEELERAIEALDADGVPRDELYHPLMIARLSPEDTTSYVDDLNTCHLTDHSAEDLTKDTDGNYLIIIAGHRRHRAIGRIIERRGKDPALSEIPCSVYDGISFEEALRIQINENTHQQLTVTEQARAINSLYSYGQAKGRYEVFSDLVNDLPFGEDKIRNAIRFCQLPEEVQEAVEQELIPYGCAIALHKFIRVFPKLYEGRLVGGRSKEEVDMLIDDSIKTGVKNIRNNRWTRSITEQFVEEILKSHYPEIADLEMRLFEIDEFEIARKRRFQITKELLYRSVDNIRLFRMLNNGAFFARLSPEEKEGLYEQLMEAAQLVGGLASQEQKPQEIQLNLAG